MNPKEKQELSESDVKAKFITPAIVKAGWDELTQIRREVTLTPGPVVVRGNLSSRNKKKKKFADYVLQKEKGVPIAEVEAKSHSHTISNGLQQALGYAQLLDVPCAFSSNGEGFASHNRVASKGDDTEIELAMNQFPSPDELWHRYKQFRGIKDVDDLLVTQPYFDDGSGKEPRYYQAEAINRVIEKVAQGESAYCLSWLRVLARHTRLSRLFIACGKQKRLGKFCFWLTGTFWWIRLSLMTLNPLAR